jgi:hypothetical protein
LRTRGFCRFASGAHDPNRRIPRCQEARDVGLARATCSRACGTNSQIRRAHGSSGLQKQEIPGSTGRISVEPVARKFAVSCSQEQAIRRNVAGVSRDLLQSKLSGFTAYGPNQRIPRCQENRDIMLARATCSRACGTGFTGSITHKFADPWHGTTGFTVYHGFS